MLSSTLGLALPPRPHPFCLYNFKVPNGVRFQRPIFLRESGSSETLEDSSAPLFCGNKDSSETPEDSSAPFSAGKDSSVAPQDSIETLEDSSAPLFCGSNVPAKQWRIPAAHFLAGFRLERHTSGLHRNNRGFQHTIILRG